MPTTGVSLTGMEVYVAILTLAFGAFSLSLLSYVAIKSEAIANSDFRRYFLVIVLVTGTLLLVATGYDDRQIAPVIGFFGTIVGYILGRSNSSRDKGPTADDKDQAPPARGGGREP